MRAHTHVGDAYVPSVEADINLLLQVCSAVAIAIQSPHWFYCGIFIVMFYNPECMNTFKRTFSPIFMKYHDLYRHQHPVTACNKQNIAYLSYRVEFTL